MKNCELCNELARIYCESDHADLCWDCDLKVHSANFLVAKHLRTLLCNVCQSPTAWSAAGVKIGRTISVCEKCVNEEGNNRQEEEEEEIDLEDFQVVPWSSTSPPPPASFSSSDQSLTEIFSLKRMHEDDYSGASTSHRENSAPTAAVESVVSISTRMRMPLKIQRTEEILPGRVDIADSARI